MSRPAWLRAFDTVTDDVRTRVRGARPVPARVGLGKLDGRAGGRRAGRARADPGEHESGVPLEEPLRANASGGTALRRVQLERGHLDVATGRRDHHRLAVLAVVG